MARFVRFIVHQRIRGEARHLGPFSAAYYLREEGDLHKNDRERLERLLGWFRTNLTVPPEGSIPPKSIFWYKHVDPFSRPMWALAQLLDKYNFTTELITTTAIGRVVYEDRYQYAAIPSKRRHR